MAWPLCPLETLWCAAALMAGYGVRGVAGFGSGVVATPLVSFVLPLSSTAPLMTLLGFLVSVRQALRGWHEIEWRAVLPFIPGAFVGALISTLFGGLAGPLYVTYFDSLRLAKGAFRVTVSTTLLTLAVVRSTGYFATGVFRAEGLNLVAAALLPAAVGTLAGEWVHDRIEQQSFRRYVGALLVVSGTALLLR